MKKCFYCKSKDVKPGETELELEVAGRTFKAVAPALVCRQCGEDYVDHDTLGAFELAVAADLARNGPSTGEVFAFMRKALGMKALDVAELMDVTPETVSRWEHGKLKAERRAVALLGAIVQDRIEGRTTTQDRLQTFQDPRPPRTNLLNLGS